VAEFLSPGVFIEEVPSAVQTIAAVSTSNLGIAGFTSKGPTDVATLVTSSDQFFKKFGALSPDTFTGLNLLAFFANGGRRAFVIRVMPSDSSEADCDLQSKKYDQQVEEGDGSTAAFSKTDLTTGLVVNSGATPIIGKNASNPATFNIRWRHAGTPVLAERVKERDDATDVDLVDGTAVYEFQIATASLVALAEEDYEQLAVVPDTVTLNYDPLGGGIISVAIPAPTSGTVTTVNGDGATSDSSTIIVFDHATGRGSIRFGIEDIGDVPDASVVAASLTLDYTPTTTSFVIADDGAGALVNVTPLALTAPGTIDYNDGSYSFTTSIAPHDKAPILATYFISAWDLDPVSNGVWANNVKLQVQGNPNYFDAPTQTYTRHDVNVLDFNTESGLFVVEEAYEELNFGDSTSAEYFADVINELSDLVSVNVPAGDEAPTTLSGIAASVVLGGGDNTAASGTFGGTGAQVLAASLIAQGFDIGPRSVNIAYTSTGVQATGSITHIAKASHVDGETFTLDDGVNPPTTFEYDESGTNVPAAGNVEIDISGDTTDDDVKTSTIAAINGVTTTLLIQASDGGVGVTTLTNVNPGAYNADITETVADGGFVVTGMAGGVAETAEVITDDGTGILTGSVDPAYATTITVSGVDILPNGINYALGVANFKTLLAPAGGSVVTASFYTTPEEAVREEQFGDTDKTYTDSLAVVHYGAGTDGTFTSSTYSRTQFTDPTLSASSRGIFALNKIDEIMQVIIPDFAGDVVVTGDLLDYAAARASQPSGGDRFIILTVPVGSDAQEAVDWFRFDLGRFSKFAALYWPHIRVADPLANGRPLTVPPLGHVAGVYARTDTTRNVGKAPGGTVDGALNFLLGLESEPTQGERDFVYPNKINPLISSPQTGLAVWGVRTIAIESEWRYINARRLFMFLEKSVYNATGWIVFENNGGQLWARIAGQLNGFMNNLFNEGLFFGASPSDAFFVIVDESNNDADSINAGQVIIDVGAAPNRPAEFVRFRFQQKTIS
jgi:phage tail sheath protein FI